MTVSVQQPSVSAGPVTVEPSIWNFTVGALALLFIVYITMRGELTTYIQLLLYTPPTQASQSPNPAPTATPPSNSSISGALGGLSSAAGMIGL